MKFNKQNSEKLNNTEIVYKRFILINGIGTNLHYFMIGKLLSNKTKIDKLLSMDQNKCYEIEGINEKNIAIMAKDNMLHIKAVDELQFKIGFILENVNIDQLKMLGDIFSSSDIVSTVNSYMQIKPNHQNIITNSEGTKIYILLNGNVITISGKTF